MGDPFGKDMDNLRKHMGGGGGRQKQSKEDQKPRFTYIQEREVFVCKNGVAKSEDSVIRCQVADLKKLDELKTRISELLFDGVRVLKVWMDDGVVVYSPHLLRDRDILYASTTAEPFYGDVPPAREPTPPPSATVVEQKEQESAAPAVRSAKPDRARPFLRTEIVEDDAPTNTEAQETDLISKYGGAQHFIFSDMLIAKPQTLPQALLPVEERAAQEVPEDPVEISIKEKRKALGVSSTANALLSLLKQVDAPKAAADDLETLAQPAKVGKAQAIGDVGKVTLPGKPEAPPLQLTKKQKEQLRRQQQKKKAKKKLAKQRKREQQDAASEDDFSDEYSGDEEAAKRQKGNDQVPGPARPPVMPSKPYIVIPEKQIVETTAVSREAQKQDNQETAKCCSQMQADPCRCAAVGPHARSQPKAAHQLQDQATGSRPLPAGTVGGSDDKEKKEIAPWRPAAAYELQQQAAGPRPPPPGAAMDSSDDEAPMQDAPTRPAAAYQLQDQAARPPHPGAAMDISGDKE